MGEGERAIEREGERAPPLTGALAALAGSARLSVTTRARALRELPALDAACASHVLVASGTDLAHLPAVLCQHTPWCSRRPAAGARTTTSPMRWSRTVSRREATRTRANGRREDLHGGVRAPNDPAAEAAGGGPPCAGGHRLDPARLALALRRHV